jgi:hypothetical protein
MKTIIKILLLSFLFIGCSGEERQATQCDCVEIRYELKPGNPFYTEHSTITRDDLDCEDANDVVTYNGTFFVKIECK